MKSLSMGEKRAMYLLYILFDLEALQRKAFQGNGKYLIIEDRKEAIKYAMKNAEKGDIILLIGKGHENYQEIKGTKYPWDERKAVKEAEKEIKDEINITKNKKTTIVVKPTKKELYD